MACRDALVSWEGETAQKTPTELKTRPEVGIGMGAALPMLGGCRTVSWTVCLSDKNCQKGLPLRRRTC